MNLFDVPTTPIERLDCERSCPPLLEANRNYADAIMRGGWYGSKTHYEMVEEISARGRVKDCEKRTDGCLGAVVVNGEVVCGARMPASGLIEVKLPASEGVNNG